jgi:ketosteroid isomerase-like protein
LLRGGSRGGATCGLWRRPNRGELTGRNTARRARHTRAVSDLRLEYSEALSSLDVDGIVALMAGDVTIRVAVHDEAMHGSETARFLFGVLSEELGFIDVTAEIVEGDRAVVLFDTELRGTRAQGLNVIETAAGAIRDLTVFFRPLPALQLVADVIGARMAERFGPLDEGQGR